MAAPKTTILPGEEYPEHYLRMYQYMLDYQRRNGYPPSITEMVDNGFARSTSNITYYYDKMEALGMLIRRKGSPRAITIIPRKQWKRHEDPHNDLRVYKFTPERKQQHGQDNA